MIQGGGAQKAAAVQTLRILAAATARLRKPARSDYQQVLRRRSLAARPASQAGARRIVEFPRRPFPVTDRCSAAAGLQ